MKKSKTGTRREGGGPVQQDDIPNVTARAYFAAHAPEKPASWFQPPAPPTFVPPPELPPSIDAEDRWRIQDQEDLRADASPSTREWHKAYADYYAERRGDAQAYSQKCDIAWRWAWADAMLAGELALNPATPFS